MTPLTPEREFDGRDYRSVSFVTSYPRERWRIIPAEQLHEYKIG